MKTLQTLLIAFSLALVALLALAVANADACDFSLGVSSYGYAAPIVAKQQVYHQQAYVAPLVLPQIQYAPQQASYIVLPQKVTITRPEVRLELQQAHGYSYAAPLVLKQQAYAQPFVQKQVVVKQQRFRQQQFRQDNRGGLLGRIQDNIQARRADRQNFRQRQAIQRGAFRLSLGH